MDKLSTIAYRKGGDSQRLNGWMKREKNSIRVPDSVKVNGNCQIVYTDCKVIHTDFKAKKGGSSPPPV